MNTRLTTVAQDSSLTTINNSIGTTNTNLTNIYSIVNTIDTKTPQLGIADDQTSVPVTISSNQFGQPGKESQAVFTVQGTNGGNPLSVTPDGNFAEETGGNLDSINGKIPQLGQGDDKSSVPVTISYNQFGQPGSESQAVFTVQGSNGGTPVPVSPGGNFAGETGGNLDSINSKLSGVATINSSIGTTNTNLTTINSNIGITNTRLSNIITNTSNANTNLNSIITNTSNANTYLNLIEIDSRAINGTLGTVNSSILAGPNNVATALRDSFQTFANGTNWTLSQGSGDIVVVDGNSGGASYLVISKDPLTAGTETSITSTATFTVPTELTTGLSMSQRTLGQELAVEIVSSDTQNTPTANLAISSISQSGTTLTVTTTLAHGLVPGARIGIFGVVGDSRLNYPAIVVGNITTAFIFTVTQGPNGAISNNTTSTFYAPYAGTVYIRPALGYAQDGMSFIFENTTLTNCSAYVRQDNGATWSSGTVNQNHSTNIGSTVSQKYDNNTLYTYNFTPATEYRMMLQSDRATITDAGVDSTNFVGTNTRISRTQQVPNSTKTYRLRYRFTNDAGLTIPTAKIVSATKLSSGTANIVTASTHGLTAGDYVVIYGINDQTNFPNISSGHAQVLASPVPSGTTFSVIFGATTASTITSYGGMVARAQGGANYPTGFINLSVTFAQVATNSAGSNELTITGPTGYSTNFLIGDYVNVYGVRNTTNGGDVGVDGTYKVVANSATTVILSPLGTTTLNSPFGSTACGGFVIKRTDARIHFSRMLNFQRERVELNARADPSNSYPVTIAACNSIITTNLSLNGTYIDIASATITTTTTTNISTVNGTVSYGAIINVSAASGTGQTMDVVIQESDDAGTNFFDVYHFPRITATGQYRTPMIATTGNKTRYVQTIGGTASFTRSITRVGNNALFPFFRQFYDRTIVPITLSSNTLSYNVQGSKDLTVMVSMGAVTTTAPVMQVQISPDNSSWVQVGSNITTVASTNTFFQVSGVQANFVRLIVSTAGTGATLNFVFIKAMG
jgi:hypothetical protein